LARLRLRRYKTAPRQRPAAGELSLDMYKMRDGLQKAGLICLDTMEESMSLGTKRTFHYVRFTIAKRCKADFDMAVRYTIDLQAYEPSFLQTRRN